jgi:hypothetical protein
MNVVQLATKKEILSGEAQNELGSAPFAMFRPEEGRKRFIAISEGKRNCLLVKDYGGTGNRISSKIW